MVSDLTASDQLKVLLNFLQGSWDTEDKIGNRESEDKDLSEHSLVSGRQ